MMSLWSYRSSSLVRSRIFHALTWDSPYRCGNHPRLYYFRWWIRLPTIFLDGRPH
uniref:Uncharacterized protein n=1 Tax=Arundo donax TaxID=35708 RepID=A0A0A8ZU94_ARUDO